MSLLNEFEEEEMEKEEDLEEFIKNYINSELSKNNASELLNLLKSKILEIELAKKSFEEEMNKRYEEDRAYRNSINTIIKEQIEITDRYKETVDDNHKKLNERIDEIEHLNNLFIDTMKKENFFGKITNAIEKIMSEKFSTIGSTVEKHFENTGITIGNLKTFFYITIFVNVAILVIYATVFYFSVIKIQNQIDDFEIFYRSIIRNEKKYWYDEENHQVYIKRLEDLDKEKNKNSQPKKRKK